MLHLVGFFMKDGDGTLDQNVHFQLFFDEKKHHFETRHILIFKNCLKHAVFLSRRAAFTVHPA